MNLPLFVPSPALLARWHIDLRVLNERSWAAVFGQPAGASVIKKHPNSTSSMIYDPNNELSYDAVLEWIELADFYQWPHIVRFNSWEDLFEKLCSTDLLRVSQAMAEYNKEEEARIERTWFGVVNKISVHQDDKEPLPSSLDAALRQSYQYDLASAQEQEC